MLFNMQVLSEVKSLLEKKESDIITLLVKTLQSLETIGKAELESIRPRDREILIRTVYLLFHLLRIFSRNTKGIDVKIFPADFKVLYYIGRERRVEGVTHNFNFHHILLSRNLLYISYPDIQCHMSPCFNIYQLKYTKTTDLIRI